MQCIQKVQSVDKKRKKHSVRAAQHFPATFYAIHLTQHALYFQQHSSSSI